MYGKGGGVGVFGELFEVWFNLILLLLGQLISAFCNYSTGLFRTKVREGLNFILEHSGAYYNGLNETLRLRHGGRVKSDKDVEENKSLRYWVNVVLIKVLIMGITHALISLATYTLLLCHAFTYKFVSDIGTLSGSYLLVLKK